MRVFIDAHALVWIVRSPGRVLARAARLIKKVASTVLVSAVTAWEITNKVRLGKLEFDARFIDEFETRIRAFAFVPLAVTTVHVVIGARLPGHHKDPFDRLLAGQAIAENFTLITADPALAALGA